MSSVTLKHLSVFYNVYKENSVTRAAEKLGLTQPQVSHYIHDLEHIYSISLFQRSGRGIRRTQAAIELFEYASHIISMYDEMNSKMNNWNEAGKLRIGSSISIGACLMPLYIKKFKQTHPDTQVAVTIDSSDIIEQMLQESKLDFALIEGIPHASNIIIEPFMEDELVLVCNPDSSLAEKSLVSTNGTVTIEDLEDQPLLLREKNSATRNLAEESLVHLGMSVNPVWESTSTTAIINAVIENLGISILPRRFLASYINDKKVLPLKLENVDFKRTYNIIYHKNKYLSQSAVDFLNMVENTD